MDDTKKVEVKEQTSFVKLDDVKDIVQEAMAKSNETLERRVKSMEDSKEEKALFDGAKSKNKTIKFFNDLVFGDKSFTKQMHDERKKYLNETTSTSGAYLVPEEFEREVLRYINEYSQIRSNATVLPMASDVKRLNTLTAEPTVYIVGEGTTITASDLTFGEPVLTAKKYGAIVEYTSELDEDSEAPLLALLQERIAEGIAKKEQDEFVNGATGGSEGILQVSGVSGISLNSGTTFSHLTWDDLADMEAEVYKRSVNEAKNGKFYMSMTAYNILRQLKASTGGNYFTLPPAPQKEVPAMAWGHEIVILNEFPTATATATKFVVFGDLKRHAFIGDRRGVTVSLSTEATVGSENLFEKDMSALKVTKRTAFCVALPSGICTLATN